MKKQLLLTAILLTPLFSFSQKFENKTTYWAKSNKIQNTKQALNKNVSVNGNTNQSLITPIGSGESNFYIVFKSEDNVEKDLLDFTLSYYQQTITTHNINYNGAQNIDQKRKTGVIMKFGFNYPNAVPDKSFAVVNDATNDLTDVYEVIYVNDAFTELDHQKIQTYLSLKYGISLINTANYIDSNGVSIWKNDLNSLYNSFITGIGRNDYFDLNKLQTTNSVDKRLEISSNGFANNEYLLIGTNNEKQTWIVNDEIEILDSSWLVQTNAKSNLTTLKFNLENLNNTENYELVLNPSANFELSTNNLQIPGKIEGNQLVFENVMFDLDGSGSDSFTIARILKTKEISKPELASNIEINAFPNPATINETVTVHYNFNKATNLNIYVFTVDGKFMQKQEVKNTAEHEFSTSFATAGVYLIVSTYNGQVKTNRIVVKQ